MCFAIQAFSLKVEYNTSLFSATATVNVHVLRFDERQLTINAVHQGLCEASELVPK